MFVWKFESSLNIEIVHNIILFLNMRPKTLP